MSNIKEVRISGHLPYDMGNDPEVQRLVGILNGPTMGFRLKWVGSQYFANVNGGSTAMFHYNIAGEEAVRDEFIRLIVETFSKHGPIWRCKFRDVENNTPWVDGLQLNWKIGTEWREEFVRL